MVGRGLTVGRPLGLLLTRRSENATVTLCHTGTRDLAAHMREADIVVAAAGVPGIITGDMVKPGPRRRRLACRALGRCGFDWRSGARPPVGFPPVGWTCPLRP